MAGSQKDEGRRAGFNNTPGPGWLDRSMAAKLLGGYAGLVAGPAAGANRAVAHAAESLPDDAAFLSDLMNPAASVEDAPGTSAANQVLNAGKGLIAYAVNGARHPDSVGQDVAKLAHRVNAAVNPLATPVADTVVGEAARNYNIGKNWGELGVNAALLTRGGEIADSVRALGLIPKTMDAAKLTPEFIKYLSELDDGMGHHVVPRGAYKKYVSNFPWLKAIGDSPWNVVRGKTRGDMLNLHYGVDDEVDGGRAAARSGTTGWSGSKLGMQRYGPIDRLWYGTTTPVKVAVGGGTLGAGLLVHAKAKGGHAP